MNTEWSWKQREKRKVGSEEEWRISKEEKGGFRALIFGEFGFFYGSDPESFHLIGEELAKFKWAI